MNYIYIFFLTRNDSFVQLLTDIIICSIILGGGKVGRTQFFIGVNKQQQSDTELEILHKKIQRVMAMKPT